MNPPLHFKRTLATPQKPAEDAPDIVPGLGALTGAYEQPAEQQPEGDAEGEAPK
jgi:hypothetical protein